jgi:hypothetical protein
MSRPRTDTRASVGASASGRDTSHARPDGVDDKTVEAVGKVSEALEWVERARGHLYSFHQEMGHADLILGEAADALEDAGHPEVAVRLRKGLIGCNVLDGRWTFQVVEEFDDGYYASFRHHERSVRDQLMAGRRHVYESEMKDREIDPARSDQRRRPSGDGSTG